MKQSWKDGMTIYESADASALLAKAKHPVPYPFDGTVLALLKEKNRFPQTYYLAERKDSFAFLVVYENRMNILTFGGRALYLPLRVIGFPCSFSNQGFVTNDMKLVFDFAKTLPGAKLVLNVDEKTRAAGFICGETLPVCLMRLDFVSAEAYLEALRAPYRRRIRRALKNCTDVTMLHINGVMPWEEDVCYPLYLNTYRKSDYKLEKLEYGFFRDVDADKLIFYSGSEAVGFVLLKKTDRRMNFLLCGMDYSRDTADLYYCMLYRIIEFAIAQRCTEIDFGQTSEETKLKFGAQLQKKYFYAAHSNPLIRLAARIGKSALEYRYAFPAYRVFREAER